MSETQVYHGLASIQLNNEAIMSKKRYVSIQNDLLRNKDLPDTAGWLLINLLSHDSDWDISIRKLAGTRRFGNVGKVQKSLDILRELGYVRLTKLSDGRSIWYVTDTPWQFGDEDSL